jgi:hypothetical protein
MDRRTAITVWLLGVIVMRLVEPDGIDFGTRAGIFCAAMIACRCLLLGQSQRRRTLTILANDP